MTNQNAIIELKIIRNVYANMRIEYRSCVEALDMAISSLQEQILNDYSEEVRKHTDIYREIKTKGDLIERQAACELCTEYFDSDDCSGGDVAMNIQSELLGLPSAQPERRKGHKVDKSDGFVDYWVCDQCGKIICPTDNYCARCGAYLREDTNERFNKQTGGD